MHGTRRTKDEKVDDPVLILSLVTPLVSATLHARPVRRERGTTEHMDEAAEEATTTEETPALDAPL